MMDCLSVSALSGVDFNSDCLLRLGGESIGVWCFSLEEYADDKVSGVRVVVSISGENG